MKFKDLQLLVNKEISSNIFLDRNKSEILSYINSSQNNRGVINIFSDFTEMINPISLKELVELLGIYLEEYILEWELEYILSCLDGCEIDNSRIEKVISSFANPYLNYYISKENIERTIKYLKKESLNLYLESVDIRLKQKGIGFRPNYRSKIIEYGIISK